MVARLLTALLLASLTEDVVLAQTSNRIKLAVIIPRDSSVTDVSQADLRRIYLGSITRWPDDHRIIPVLRDPDSDSGRLFLKRVVRMTDIDYAQHWIGQVFRGQASSPPRVVHSAAEAKRYVAGHPYSISFVAPEDVDGSVTALRVDGKAIDAGDYPLAW
jgi:ABC-type phosphate transport system substrate-binding protein